MTRSVFNHRRHVASDTYFDAVMADSPLVYWRLDESSGSTATDSSGNGRNGTYTTAGTGSITYSVTSALTSGDTAVTLNSAASSTTNIAYVTRAASTDFDTSNVTVEAFVKPVSGNSSNLTIGRLAGFRWRFQVRAALDGLIFGASGLHTYTATISSSSWQHVAVTWDGATATCYLNGSSIGTSSTGILTSQTNGALLVGSTSIENYSGGVDEFAVYGTALSSARIAAHYAAR